MIDWKMIDELEWIGTEESIKESERLIQEYYNKLAEKQQKIDDIEKNINKEPNLTENDIAFD